MASSQTPEFEPPGFSSDWTIRESDLPADLVDRGNEYPQVNDLSAYQISVFDNVPYPTINVGTGNTEKLPGVSAIHKTANALPSGTRPSVKSEPTDQISLNAPHRPSTSRVTSKSCGKQVVIDIIDDSSDDDVVMVDEKECSEEARNKWSKSGSTGNPLVTDNSPVQIKKESTEEETDPPRLQVNMSEIRSVQLSQHNLHKSPVREGEAPAASESNGPLEKPERFERAGAPESPICTSNVTTESQELPGFMLHNSEDNTWMEQDDNGAGEAEEISKLRTIESNLKKRKDMNQLSQAESYQLARVTNQLEVIKRRMIIANRRDEGDDTMFVSDAVRNTAGGGGNSNFEETGGQTQDQVDNDGQPVWEPEVADAGKKSTKRRKHAKNAREVEERRREKEREKKEKARKKRDKLGPPKNSRNQGGAVPSKVLKGKPREMKDVTQRPEYRSHMKNTKNRGDDALGSIVASLTRSDFVRERLAQADFGQAPEIHETSKKRQMDALMASVPNEYDTHNSKIQKSDLLKASRNFGYGNVIASDGKWKLKGMKSSLYHHQLLAADWMVKQELGEEEPHGGLLADAMGLGKTVEVIATMVGNPLPESEAKSQVKATLLVLPSSVIKQWADEIDAHTEPHIFPKVIQYRARSELPDWSLRSADIVLTSYAEVMASFPFPSKDEMEEFDRYGGYYEWAKACNRAPGVLHKIKWYRVVLDEAHAIKNFKSRTSVACQNLKGRYRWAVSGTPVQNRLEELFPYFRFLRAPWASDYLTFKKQYCEPEAEDSRARMAVILSIVMRRTMKDSILGRPIVELPTIHSSSCFVSFSKEERVLYRVLENHFRDNLNMHFREGTANKNYSVFMVQLLRLRQCTAHPFLLEDTVKQILNWEEIVHLKAELKKLSQNRKPIYEQIQQWLPATEEERMAALGRGDPVGALGEPVPFGRSEFGKYFHMDKCLDALNAEELQERTLCRICSDVPVNPRITDCNHVFCEACLKDHMEVQVSRGNGEDVTTCPSCQRIVSLVKTYTELSLNGYDDTSFDSMAPQQSLGPHSSQPRRSRASNSLHDPYTGPSVWLSLYKTDNKKYLVPSAKTIAFKAKVLQWLGEAPKDKILVFTQFRMMAKILGLIAESEKWGFVYFTGNMNPAQRYEAVKRFHDDPKISIMIAGLKCGGQALNLTCANRVISMDLWWNHSVEQQAFGRVFRIGQHKETHVCRIIVKNTVDGRMLDMQSEKVRTIDTALQDTGDIVEPLPLEELASLFGHLREGDDGKLRVEEDYEEEDEDEDDVDGGGNAWGGGNGGNVVMID